MLPVARQALRRIGDGTDVVTYVSRYTRGRFASAFGPRRGAGAPAAGRGHRPSSRPTRPPARRCAPRYGLGERPVVVCLSRLVPRKGQDMLIRALPRDPRARRRRGAGDRRRRTVPGDAAPARAARPGVAEHVVFTGGVPGAELPAHHAMADVFAMPCRTRGAGLDVEGLGIVYLEASATGRAGGRRRSGGAPETVRDGETGRVVERQRRRRNRHGHRRTTRRPGPGGPRWAPPGAAGPSTTGSGALRRRDCQPAAGCSVSPCRRALRCRRRTSRPPPCA